MVDTKSVGAGSIATELPAGQNGPTDSIDNSPVKPRLTDDYQGPPPSNSVFTSLTYPQWGNFSTTIHADPLDMKTGAHGLDLGYAAEPTVTPEGYNYDTESDLTIGLAGLNVDGTKLAAASDWTATADWDGQMRATMGQGMPFVYVTRQSGAAVVIDLHQQTGSTRDKPTNALTYTLSGLSGSFSGNGTSFDFGIDAGAHVADGLQARISYDFDGDGKYNRVETFDWFGTDAAVGDESYKSGKMNIATGAMADMKNGAVKVELWKANGQDDISVTTNSVSSFVKLPFKGLTTTDGSVAGDGTLYLQGGAKAGSIASTLATTPGATPTVDTTHFVPPTSVGGYTGPGQIWYNQNGVVGVTINGKSYGIFGPSGATWTYTEQGLTSDLSGKDYYSVAVLPDSSLTTLMQFREHAYAFVTDTKSSYSVDPVTGLVTTTFTATTEMKENGPGLSGDPLMALYRHQYIHSDGAVSDVSYQSPRGEIKVIAGGSSFSTTLQAEPILPIMPFVGSDEQKAQIQSMLHDELKAFLSKDEPFGAPGEGDTYWTPRQLAKLGDLALMAQQVGYGQVRDVFVGAIEKKLESWFNAADGDVYKFYYDKDWATLIGFPASYDSNDKLNDHHFHYGYFINAAATVAQLDPSWATQSKWGAMVNQLIADAANWDRNDPTYTYLRTFDPYAGHSWASGTGDDGLNQESASEALEFASAVARWGAVTGQKDIQDLGIYLHTTESDAFEQYWQDVDKAVFPNGVESAQMGVVGANGGKYTNFFDGDPAHITGINYTPINGGSLFLAEHPEELKEELAYLASLQKGDRDSEWMNGTQMVRALFDPEGAMADYLANPQYQSGGGEESRVYTLSWIQSMMSMGTLDSTVHANTAFAAVFSKNGVRSYVAFNAGSSASTVTFSDGKILQVGAGDMVTLTGDGVLHTVDYQNNDIPQRPDGIPADLPTDPPTHALRMLVANGDLILSVEEVTGTVWLTQGSGQPVALLASNGDRSGLKINEDTTIVSIGRDQAGGLVLLGMTPRGQFYPYSVSAKLRIAGGGGAAMYASAYRTLEPQFGIDFNGDGIVLQGQLDTVATNGGLKLLIDRGSGLAYYQDGDGGLVGISRWADAGVAQLARGDWSLAAIGRDEDGNVLVLDRSDHAGISYAWKLDAKGGWTAETIFDGHNVAEAEALFQRDLDGDGLVPKASPQFVASNGALKLLVDPSTGFAIVQLEDGSRVTVQRDGWGEGVLLDRGSKLFAVGRDDLGRLRVLDGNPADKDAATNRWGWILDASGKFVGETVFDAHNVVEAEDIYGKDLDGDGITGAAMKLLDRNGGNALYVDQRSGKAYVSFDGHDPLLVTRDGWGDVLQQRGEWGLAAIATDAEGRTRVLDASPFSDAKYSWILDANGHFSGEQSYDASTIGDAEKLFAADLNHDGKIGAASTSSLSALV